jgi:hypothetical protein
VVLALLIWRPCPRVPSCLDFGNTLPTKLYITVGPDLLVVALPMLFDSH